jgi:uncharacterized protein YegP (UPF0339 family)
MAQQALSIDRSSTMSGWYELSKSSNGQFRFVLKAANAETILTSELYTTRSAAESGIASVQANSPLNATRKKTPRTAIRTSTSRPPIIRSSVAVRPIPLMQHGTKVLPASKPTGRAPW